jgi:uncharacterized protein
LTPKIKIRELESINLEGGYLVDGFPSAGFSSAIASESMIKTSQFKMVGIIDSDIFPAISVIKDKKPNFPSRIFINEDLKVGIFLSYITLDQTLHKVAAKTMLKWAQKHKIKLIISSIAVKSSEGNEETIGVGSTESARKRIQDVGLKVLDHGTVPGIPGTLLNEGSMIGQDVIVLIFQTDGNAPDFKSGTQLCSAISKLIPGATCDISSLQQEAEKAEQMIKETEEESKHLRNSMYR